MIGRIQKNRLRLNRDLPDADARQWFSPTRHLTHQAIVKAIKNQARGKLLDIGCGDMQYEQYITKYVSQYDTLDIEKRVERVKYVADVQNMVIVPDAVYDSAVCISILEHVPDPGAAVREIYRILKTEGTLIITVPHLCRLHEEPHDYFRYTRYGLRYLLEKAGFTIIQMEPVGGLFSFLGHQFSTVFVCLFWGTPFLGKVAFFLNKWFCTKLCAWLDHHTDRNKLLALNYLCVARKI